MRLAYLIMDKIFDSKKDKASIHNGVSQIIGVSNIEEILKNKMIFTKNYFLIKYYLLILFIQTYIDNFSSCVRIY